MNNKKIMIVANDTTFIYNLRKEIVEGFLESRYDVVVVAKKLKFINEIEEMGCDLIDLNLERNGTNPMSDIKLFRQISFILKNQKPDLVFSNSIKPNVYFGIACRKQNIPFIPNITGLGGALLNPGIVQKVAIFLYRQGMKAANTVLFQNEFNRQFFWDKKIIKSNQDNILLPGSGINLEKFRYKQYPNDGEPIKFVTISRVMRDKGIDELLESATYIKNKYPNVIFQLVGAYDDASYKNVIEEMVKDGIIEYLGFKKDINEILSDSYCVIHPSYHEGLSNVLLEAGATGRPVIASDIPGCREAFIDGISGFSVKAKNSDDLKETIERFINLSYKDKERMGIENRKYIEEKFDRNIVVKKCLECAKVYIK